MKPAKHNSWFFAPRTIAIRGWRAVSLLAFGTVLLFFGAATSVQGADTYGTALDQRFAAPRDSTNTLAPESPKDPHLIALERALKAQQEKISRGTDAEAAPVSTGPSRGTLMAFAAIFLTVTLVFVRFVKAFNSNRKQLAALAQKEAEEALRKKIIAEQPTLVALFNDLRHGLEPALDVADGKSADNSTETTTDRSSNEERLNRLHEFYELAPERISGLRNQLAKLSSMPEKTTRVELIREFFYRVEAFRRVSDLPELRPVWLMSCGLSGLLQQLSTTATDLNPSIMRTTASALNLLEDLSVPGIDSDLATRTRVQLLAVDDNAVCRAALSLALKKAFHEPDVASGGKAALALAEKNIYDAIFLDIEMPGMDGFELCTKIHETALNQKTPIVFVTSHGDFESRAKSSQVGGQSLIAKPYRSFEITVKALTLTLRGRLQKNSERPRSRQLAAA